MATKKKKRAVYLPEDLDELVLAETEREGRTINSIIIRALRVYFVVERA